MLLIFQTHRKLQ